jgi:hypothetical protein
MNDAISIGTVPTGSVVIRKATMADLRDDPSRVVLVQHPDGRYVWLGVTRDERALTSSSDISR